MINADHAATTRLSDHALQAMLPWLQEDYGNPSQIYSFARKPRKAITAARETIAQCINAKPEEIFFTSGGTESDNWAIKGYTATQKASKALLASAIEHHAVLHACQAVQRFRHVFYLSPDSQGVIPPAVLNAAMFEDVGMVSVMLANNELGTIQPIRALADIAHRSGAVFHTDAVQAVGHIPVDVESLGVDLLSASAHKFNGPKGVGFLYIRSGTPIARHEDGGSQESGMRAGTENVAGIVGMATALADHCRLLKEEQMILRNLTALLLDSIKDIQFIQHGRDAACLPGVLSLSFPGFEGEAILHCLDLMGILVSTGSACDSRRTVRSHVLKAIGCTDEDADGTIRISLGLDNSPEDIRAISNALHRIILRKL